MVLSDFLATAGVSHLTTPPHTPEHNGFSERRHRHIVETGLSLLSHASIPPTYWTYALAVAVYLINRQPTPTLSLSFAHEKLFGIKPNYMKLRTFGCLCFPWLRPYTKHKLEDRSKSCVFLGYSTSQSAYLCLHVATKRVYTSRHIVFDETVFPFAQPQTSSAPASHVEDTTSPPSVHTPITTIPLSNPAPQLSSPSPCLDPHQQPHPASPSSPQQSQVSSSSSDSPSHTSFPSHSEPTVPNQNGPQPTAQTPHQTNK